MIVGEGNEGIKVIEQKTKGENYIRIIRVEVADTHEGFKALYLA